jgi:tripartite-type tricarboxylate transporter receptor subunit TctC
MRDISKKAGIIIALLTLSLIFSMVLAGCGKSEQKKEVKWPEKPVTVIVPYGPGGGADQVARILAGIAEKKTGVKFTVVNKTGAVGSTGLLELSKANPDGYTIGIMPSNISTYKVAGIAPLTYEDFKLAIAVNYDACALIVRKDSGWNTFEDFKKAAQTKELKVATGSPGGLWHLGVIELENKTGLKFNIIPMSTGGAPAGVQLLGGHVDAIVIGPNEAASQIKSGDFKILAVMAPERSENFKDVPTFKELGYDIDVRSVRGIAAPKGTPDDIVKKIHDVFKEAAQDQQYKDYMKNSLSNATYMSTEEYTKYAANELISYSELMKKAGLAKEGK